MQRQRRERKIAKDTFHGPRFAQEEVAAAMGHALDADAQLLAIVMRNCEALPGANGTRAMDETELHHLEVAVGLMDGARRRLAAISKRMERKANP